MATKLLVTTAGLDKIVAAEQGGTDKVTITTCKLGSSAYTPTASQTDIKGTALATLTTVAGGAVAGNVVHVEVTDASSAAYTAYEAGLFDSDGLLIAIASGSDAIATKGTASQLLLSFDIAFTDALADSVTFGSTDYNLPPATTTVQGVVELATSAEASAGTDAARAVTPAALRAALLEMVYPVGSVYMSLGSTSPATFLGGTWTKIQGSFLLASSSSIAAGATGGASTHALTVAEMPSHNHGGTTGSAGGHTPAGKISGGSHTHSGTTASNGAHTHTRGTMDITGTFSFENTAESFVATGAFYSGSENNKKGIGKADSDNALCHFQASKSWSGATSSNGAHTHTITTGSTTPSMTFTGTAVAAHTHSVSAQGSGSAFSLLPPYIAVNVWKRTA